MEWVWVVATLIPLAAFIVEIFLGKLLGKATGYLATAAIGTSFMLSAMGLLWYVSFKPDAVKPPVHHHAEHAAHDDHGHAKDAHGKDAHAKDDHGHAPAASGPKLVHKSLAWATLIRGSEGGVGKPIGVRIGFYVDHLTAFMFFMVTLVATCVHIYSLGYMSHEPRFHRFFTFLSLFCFSMLALVVSDNLVQVFMCWELVGVCSYFLIGFYYEKRSATNACNKAFITNRVGDVGFIVGLMTLFASVGQFGFIELWGEDGLLRHGPETINHFWLTVAGIGIFVGCVGKSAQFPLHVWLPDAMEGPTPVSALIHAATMVAAGVYLVARAFPLFTPEALLVITYTGGITLFVAASIAVVATDIKRALAYSTVSQLGYMMLALGIGGWVAGLMHLITHAFFKALLFLCSGSVIHGAGTQEMPQMGGLYKKMPYTAITMLIGVMAISAFPLMSGFYSKDAIIAHTFAFVEASPQHTVILMLPAIVGGITTFYMFRLWFLTFAGKPRDHHVYDHAHESGPSMVVPLCILAFFAIFAAGIPWFPGTPTLESFLAYGQPAAANAGHLKGLEARAHELHGVASLVATGSGLVGASLAFAIYYFGLLNPDDAKKQFLSAYTLFINKWYFDELYRYLFVRPVMIISYAITWIDKHVIDWSLDTTAKTTVKVSDADGAFDRMVVDGAFNLLGNSTYSWAESLRVVQSGWLRGYVMYIAIGTASLFAIMAFFFI